MEKKVVEVVEVAGEVIEKVSWVKGLKIVGVGVVGVVAAVSIYKGVKRFLTKRNLNKKVVTSETEKETDSE